MARRSCSTEIRYGIYLIGLADYTAKASPITLLLESLGLSHRPRRWTRIRVWDLVPSHRRGRCSATPHLGRPPRHRAPQSPAPARPSHLLVSDLQRRRRRRRKAPPPRWLRPCMKVGSMLAQSEGWGRKGLGEGVGGVDPAVSVLAAQRRHLRGSAVGPTPLPHRAENKLLGPAVHRGASISASAQLLSACKASSA